ncbi:DNA polymerase III subunit tau [Caulifigura coniformis]|uniref:DNA polymerase III subunit tau n=1 Tax=Caulifigura coniformis TaxID=2527983 RepID=A0A517SEW3_9PLAN|nr:AAA family ATPase [Caulifigura coniformis]QDT54671.1 DNA polymerase III subunit tau [Caulifigura coniformis]
MDLCRKYAPRLLSDLRGQPDVVSKLKGFVSRPHGRAFLFSGGSGVGKTAAAWALARELNPGLDERNVRIGTTELSSGCQDAESVRELVSRFAYRPIVGRASVLILNEAESMHPKAREVWLDALERLPSHSVVVFTTNNPDSFEARFQDRCAHYRFQDTRPSLLTPIRTLANDIWRAEVGTSKCPLSADELCPHGSAPSFRRAVRRVEEAIQGMAA